MMKAEAVESSTVTKNLPDDWRWVRLADICEVNPRRPELTRSDDALTTFIPMAAVDDITHTVAQPEQKPYASIRRGYTYFTEGDVLFAKITPCMQNGKHAIARNLIDGIGFGSTEFHVLHPQGEVTAEWLHYFLVQPAILEDAANHFSGSVGQQRVPQSYLSESRIPLPPLAEQQRIVATLTEQMAAVNKIREAVERQIELTTSLIDSFLRESLLDSNARSLTLNDCLTEVSRGVGESWENYRVIGATRSGLAPAKAPVGKSPERYKLVDKGTIFYNPMRILIGSIGMVDEDDEPGITSPDYVVFKALSGIVHPRWLYYWLRSSFGAAFIKTLARGAVRERMLFQRLAKAEILLPSWDTQVKVAEKLSTIAKLRQSLEEQLTATNDLPEMLLHRAFNGEV